MASNTPASDPEKRTVPLWKVVAGIFRFVENPIPIINEALEVYGSTYYTRILGGRRVIMSVDPDVIQHVLQKNHKNYIKSELQTRSLGRYIGNGLLTSNGTYWLRQRRLIQPGFHKARMAKLVDIMNEEITLYVHNLDLKIKTRSEFDMSEEMMELTLRIVSKSLFSTGISDEKIRELGRNFTVLQMQIVREVRQPFLNFWRRWSGKRRQTHKLAEQTKQIVRDIIHHRKTGKTRYDDLLDMLLDTRYEDTGQPMDDQQLLDEAIILFTAGHETTANALVWILYLLDNNRESLEQLRKEIDVFGDETPTFETVRRLEYTAQVANEGLRMFPPAWILDRIALEEDTVKDVHIGKGDMVGLYVYGTHHNTRLWENPEAFNPDRFSKDRIKKLPSYAYFPFGGGPRQCIGNHFALLEMQLALFHLVKKFDFKGLKNEAVEMQPLVTLRPRDGMPMQVTSRQ